MNQYKKIELPMTGEQVWKVLLIFGWVGVFSIPYLTHLLNGNINSLYFGLYGLELSATITMSIICPLIYSWDVNPFHKIGYCISMKTNEQHSPNEVKHD